MDLEQKKDVLATLFHLNRKELDAIPTFYIVAFHQLFVEIAYLHEAFFELEEDSIIGMETTPTDFQA